MVLAFIVKRSVLDRRCYRKPCRDGRRNRPKGQVAHELPKRRRTAIDEAMKAHQTEDRPEWDRFDMGGRSLQQKADQTGNPAHGPPVAEREPRRRMAHSGHHRSRCTTGAVHHHHRRHPRRRVDRPIRLHSPAQQRFHRTRQAVGPEEFGRHTAHRAGGQPARISDEIQVLSRRSRPQQTVSLRPPWLNHPDGRPSHIYTNTLPQDT